MSKKDVIILHGTMGSPEGNWFPWLKSQLENDYNVYVPRFPTPDNQSKETWCAALRDQAPIFGKDTILQNIFASSLHGLTVQSRKGTK